MKSKVALFVIGAIAFSSAVNAAEIYNKNGNKLDFYGKVKGEHDFTEHTNNDATYARIGIRGETQINDQLIGFGQWEYNVPANQPEGAQDAAQTRLAFAGISAGDFGSFDYGRNWGVVYDIGSYADNMTEFGGDSYQYTDNFMNGRSTGLATYRNKNFFGLVDGLAFAAQYQGKNEDGRNPAKANGDGYGFSLQYDIADTGLTLGGAYSHSNTTFSQRNGSDTFIGSDAKNAEAWTVGAKYAANAFYLATTYAETHNMTPVTSSDVTAFAPKTKNFEAMANYTFDFGLQPSLGYVQSKAEGYGESEDVVKYAQIGLAYFLNKNFVVDAAYKVNLLKSDNALGLASDDQTVLGATYQF